MELNYCINTEAETPIMFIDKHIGWDELDGQGVMGDVFMKELMYLDTLGKENIEILINSPGGVVTDGMSIYHSIRAAKTPITTHCIGLAASIAAVIFQAGDKRIMNDYGILMLHNPSGGDSKSLYNFKEAILAMVARSGVNEAKISKLMDGETWMNGNDNKFTGTFWDEVNATEKIQGKRELSAVINSANNIINSILNEEKIKIMDNKVKNSLGLNEEASTEEILDAIEVLKTPVTNLVSDACGEETKNVDAPVAPSEDMPAEEPKTPSMEEMMTKCMEEIAALKLAVAGLLAEETTEVEEPSTPETAPTEAPENGMLEDYTEEELADMSEEELKILEDGGEIADKVTNKVEIVTDKVGVNILNNINNVTKQNTSMASMMLAIKNKNK